MTTIPSIFEQVQLSLSEKENGTKKYEQLLQNLLKAIKKEAIDFVEAFDIIKGYQTITIQEETNETIIDAMRSLETTKCEVLKPVRLFIGKNGHSLVAHSFLNGEFGKKTHGSLTKIDGTYHRIVDIHRLFAETLAVNELERFARGDEDLLRYLVLRHIAQVFTSSATPLPMDGKFSFDLIKEMKQFGLLQEKTVKMPQVDAYKPIFYAEKNEEGYIQEIEHPFMLDILVPEWLTHLAHVKHEALRKKAEQATYSTSFQTKKQIKKATQEKMEKTAFLSHYGFVEIDNTVDLQIFVQWEDAFFDLVKQVPIPKSLDHSLRIRRLGKQRATGIYYATFKATVLDLDAPSAYAHELGHQLDHTQAKTKTTCSQELAFRPILHLYRTVTITQVAKLAADDPFRKEWEGKGKYNQAYYFTPTEVFARSFELYLATKGVTNLLVKPNLTGAVYPKDAILLEKITHYFDSFFQW